MVARCGRWSLSAVLLTTGLTLAPAQAQSPPPSLTSWGRYSPTAGPGLFPDGARDIAIDSQGNLYVSDNDATCNGRIQKFSAAGTYLTEWPISWCDGLGVGPGDEIYAVDYCSYTVQVFDTDGNQLRQWGSFGTGNGQLDYPEDVAATTGAVYVAEYFNQRIQKFDENGNYLDNWTVTDPDTGWLMGPSSVAIAPSGNLYVTDWDNSRVLHFAPDGTLLHRWGESGTANGEFREPFGSCVDAAGDVYVADLFSVQKFTGTGGFLWRLESGEPGAQFGSGGVALGPNGLLYHGTFQTAPPFGSVQVFGSAPFSLAADFASVATGDTLRLRTFAGEPTNLNLLGIVTVNGAPFSLPLLIAPLDGFGRLTLSSTVPANPNLPGLTLGFQSFSLDAMGKLVNTGIEAVTFQ